ISEKLGCAGDGVVADPSAEPDDHARRVVPAVEVRAERLARRAAYGLLLTDDLPAERLVAEEQVLVDTADEIARRVEIHVHLLDDHALLAVDLLGVEPRVAEHVDENVECNVAVLGGALHVVGGVLLAGERVELAADRVDFPGDIACARSALRSLEEHVLREVRDSVRLRRLVTGARGEHHHARHRLRFRQVRGHDAQPVVEDVTLVGAHSLSLLFAWNGTLSDAIRRCAADRAARHVRAASRTRSARWRGAPARRRPRPASRDLPVRPPPALYGPLPTPRRAGARGSPSPC